MTSTVLLKRGKYGGITAYVSNKTILKRMIAENEYIKPIFMFLPSLGTF
jgi:hypothetical protein